MSMAGDEGKHSVIMKAHFKTRLEQWLKKTSTAQRNDTAVKAPIVTDTYKTNYPNVARKDDDLWILSREMKMIIDQVLMNSKR